MSAPPIGSVMVIPSSSASTKKPVTIAGVALAGAITSAPRMSVAMSSSRFSSCWPRKRRLRVMRPWSLPKATALPLKETAPMMPPSTPSESCVTP